MKLGYACINLTVPTKYRTCRLKTAEEQGMEKVKELTLHNFEEVLKAIRWNIEHQIYFFRLSSELVPFATHEIMTWNWAEDEDVLYLTAQIQELTKQHSLRLSMHPGQYSVLNSPKEQVVTNAVKDLEYHNQVMNLTGGSDIVLHVGGAYGDKEQAKKSFVDSYHLLSEDIKSKLILENDDKTFHLLDVIDISRETKVPVCFDIHHHRCNPYSDDIHLKTALQEVFHSWKEKGRPKVHISSGATSRTDRSHHDFIFESEFDEFIELLGTSEVDIMFEAKQKEKSVLRILEHMSADTKKQLLE
ncbi:UV DNA damage repair endonuclease UvsE [Alkalicoccus daliensis]|uniref:UV-damage endonuclease n=1 Tax=Alkalicoccus daliensis TaxID=745820 RepID=A0A1H0GTZ2_9BACI|nr:UV DNA damage repair endonuclease UvsE [Alkalicoccus daliensis]SDO10357.1 UV-damage endonuclease [Alkalicoccus daliensis]